MTPELAAAIDALRGYLDRVGFQQIYKFVVSSVHYGAMPSMITTSTAKDVARFFDTVLGGHAELALLQCLMLGRPAERRALTDIEKQVADALIGAGLLRMDGEVVAAGDRQLISAFGLDLLIDRRIHFGGAIHEVYIGFDSYCMLYYIDPIGIRREHRAVDLCTGTGVGALYLSLFSDHVLATDIGSVPLALIEINRRLNRRDLLIEVRDQDLRETLDGRERFDLLTCNPPFVAFPPGVEGALYAQGPDVDGLGYMRAIIERLPVALNPGGTAYLVADLVGDARGPHFVEELAVFAARGALAIDVYIDNVVEAEHQIPALTGYMMSLDGARDRASTMAEVGTFVRDTLRAERYYMSTLRLRTAASRPGVRVMRRFAVPKETVRETWPTILLQS